MTKKYNFDNQTSLDSVEEAALAYNTPFNKVYFSRFGVSVNFVIDLMQSFKFSKQETAELAGISAKTLDRHFQSGRKFEALQADRLIELAELYTEGLALFGEQQKFLKWLDSKLPALNNTAPKEWLDTHHGITLISDEIGRIRHGIFA